MTSWRVRLGLAVSIAVATAGLSVAAAVGAEQGAGAAAADAPRPRMQAVDPDAPPPAQLAAEGAQEVERGVGGGLAVPPAVVWWLLVIGWAATTAWAGRDDTKVPSFTPVWLPILAFPFFFVALAAWWIPWAVVACGLTMATWLGSLIPYVALRDRMLPVERRVLSVGNATRAAVRRLQPVLRLAGIRIDLDNRTLTDTLPDIQITATPVEGAGAPEARLAEATAVGGFAEFREIVQRCMAMRADQALFEIGPQGGMVKQRIDGIWHALRHLVKRRLGLKVVEVWEEMPQLDKEQTQEILAVIKKLCGISAKTGKRQGGEFVVTLQKRSIPCRVMLEKSETALRMLWDFQPPPVAFKSIQGLGMEEGDAVKLAQALTLVNGLVVISAPAGEGLSTTFNQVVLAADRLLRDFVLLEDGRTPFREIQNVKPFRWGVPDRRDPVAVLEEAMRGYPTALVAPSLEDAPLAIELVKHAGEMLVVVGIRAADVMEAIEKMIALGVPRDDLARTLQVATGQRLLRRVCPKCAEDYEPAAEMLGRLKVPAREGLTFKRAASAGCAACSGTGHLGRGALFEVVGGPTVSKALAANVDRATLAKAAQRDGMRRFRDVGIALVTEGVTTIEEVQRILKKG